MKKSLLGVSLITMSCLYGMLLIFVFFACMVAGVELDYVILISIILLIAQFLIAPFLTDFSMKVFYKAKFDYQLPDYLNKFIAEICQQHGMKFPTIGFINDGAPNAFTYGRTKNDARIVLTRGIFELLSEDEVKAVVAHEMGHAVHYDMLFMTVCELVPLILYYVYETFTRNLDDEDSGKLAVVGLVAYVLYIISQYIILWLSRVREYYADSFAIEATKNPNALGEALVKVGYGLTTRTTKDAKMSVSKPNTLGIFDARTSKSLIVSSYDDGKISKENIKKAMRWEMWNVWAKWYEFFSTHPLISKRLMAISERCNDFGQPKYIEFDDQKLESYLDDFLGELFLVFAPTTTVFLSFILFFVGVGVNSDLLMIVSGFGPFVALLFSFIKFNRVHKNKNYKETTVSDLLSEVKVSGITSVPCVINGTIIGRGDPGCIFSEDIVINDGTGIIFLDYKRVLKIMDFITALTKTKKMVDKKAIIKGWYRRSPVPYIEIYEMEIVGEKKKRMKTYGLNKFFYILFLILFFCFGIFFVGAL